MDVEWSRRLVMLCLRLLFAPMVEHVVIADRMHFLRERGHRIHRVPLFEPKISPRNTVIIAVKEPSVQGEE